jgi:2-polyprenyl-6-hydroxyphenyl methylase / 3-demethylubiquinone-9 3-methyltransferase
MKTSFCICSSRRLIPRVGYFRRLLDEVLKFNYRGMQALDVGCGGGILAEEFASIGFRVTGIDPSERSLATAEQHAQFMGLSIQYQQGTGESIPFADNTFPVVYCCDVLEHVRDLPKLIGEIYRVTKPGGIFLIDTLNRTFISKLVAIKIWQEWKSTAFMPPRLHEWRMFIRPEELKGLLVQAGFEFKEFRGTSPDVSIAKMISLLRKRANAEIGYKELGQRFKLGESNNLKILYMGYAIKPVP